MINYLDTKKFTREQRKKIVKKILPLESRVFTQNLTSLPFSWEKLFILQGSNLPWNIDRPLADDSRDKGYT